MGGQAMANGKFPHQHPEFHTLIEALAVDTQGRMRLPPDPRLAAF